MKVMEFSQYQHKTISFKKSKYASSAVNVTCMLKKLINKNIGTGAFVVKLGYKG